CSLSRQPFNLLKAPRKDRKPGTKIPGFFVSGLDQHDTLSERAQRAQVGALDVDSRYTWGDAGTGSYATAGQFAARPETCHPAAPRPLASARGRERPQP